MTHLDNRTILEKADLALADLTGGGGILKPAQSQIVSSASHQTCRSDSTALVRHA